MKCNGICKLCGYNCRTEIIKETMEKLSPEARQDEPEELKDNLPEISSAKPPEFIIKKKLFGGYTAKEKKGK